MEHWLELFLILKLAIRLSTIFHQITIHFIIEFAEVPVKGPMRVEGTDDEDNNLEWLEDSYSDKLSISFDNPSVFHISACMKEICFFQEIFNDDSFSLIVQQTNLYADQISIRNWSPLSTPELKVYIGCLILMEINKLPKLEHYWTSDPLLSVENICDVMNSKRFEKITEALHCNNNESCSARGSPQYDKLHKIRPMNEFTNQKCRSVYECSSVVSVDESLISFKGCCSL
ncbi:hypothetical protein JTB14_025707 [Gonioctena quinquepunctata]|nr:hypothetical protein JTB14_025707 [Gonioctena quinquepunctata]